MINLVKGNLVRWINGPANNIGVVAGFDNRNVAVLFDTGENLLFALPVDVLLAVIFNIGDSVQVSPGDLLGVVIQSRSVEGLNLYEISMPDGTHPWFDEWALRPHKITDPLEMLRAGKLHSARSTNLRVSATRLFFDYKFNEFSSLSNSRMEIKPHQVGVLHRVATSYPHRFLLADEVGLGEVEWIKRTPKSGKINKRRCHYERGPTRKVYR